MKSRTNSQQQFSRTIDPTTGNSGMGMINNNGSTEDSGVLAEDKQNQNPSAQAT